MSFWDIPRVDSVQRLRIEQEQKRIASRILELSNQELGTRYNPAEDWSLVNTNQVMGLILWIRLAKLEEGMKKLERSLGA